MKQREHLRWSRPEVMVQLNQQLNVAEKAAHASVWLQPPSGQPALPEIEFPDPDWAAPDYKPPALMAPQQPVAQFMPPSAPDLSDMPAKVRESELRKYYATAQSPPQPVEAEVEVEREYGWQDAKNNFRPETELEQRMHNTWLPKGQHDNQFEPGHRITAVKPTPPPSPGFNSFGERDMISG